MRLFLRDGRRVVLTAAGKALEAECGRLFADSARIVRSVQCAAAEMKVFHIGGTLTAGGYLLPDLAGSYMKRHPDRILELKVANTNGIEEMISARKLDVALVEGPFEQKYFLSEPFIPDELLPAFAPGHCAEAFSLEEYIRCGGRLILRERGSGTRYYFDRFLQTRKLPEPTPAQYTGSEQLRCLETDRPAGTAASRSSRSWRSGTSSRRERWRRGDSRKGKLSAG